MRFSKLNAGLTKSALALSTLLLAAGAATAQSTVTLTAKPTATVLPDGQPVSMWGYACGIVSGPGVSCSAPNGSAQSALTPLGGWQPPLIVVPGGTETSPASLTITLVNQLSFSNGNTVPTSLVIVGQLGGGLGSDRALFPAGAFPHAPQGTSWPGTRGDVDPTTCAPSADPAAAGAAGTFCPPGQSQRVRSLATEVSVTDNGGKQLTWNNLRPGTYLIESGTEPSIQGPMGLYGVLVVTDPASTPSVKQAYGQTYDQDVALLLSEIDPNQNAAVTAAVNTAGFDDTRVWNGQPGQCGDPAVHTCYPPAVNYSPLYYLINGVSFDRGAAGNAVAAVPAAGPQKNVLLRFVNAGLRMHVPSVVGASLTLIAEDGNKLPGKARVQNEVFLAAGKTYDVSIQPKQSAVAGTYASGTYPVFDRALGVSTNGQRDGGMRAYINVAGGAPAAAAPALTAASKTFYCVAGVPLVVSDPSLGVLGGATGANGAVLSSFTPATTNAADTLTFNANGTFTYLPSSSTNTSCGGTIAYNVNGNGGLAKTATIAQCDAITQGSGCTLAGKPMANADAYDKFSIATRIQVSPPGILLNDKDPAGLPLTVDLTSITKTGGNAAGLTVGVNADGSLTASATSPGTYTFTYKAKNSQNSVSTNPATVSLTFPTPSNLNVVVKDAKTGVAINDYRWIIEEDRTFWIDPKCQVNASPRPKDSNGADCAPLPVESLGYNFHTANMPVVAQGCVGTVSCEAGQTLLGSAAVCNVGNGICKAGSQKDAVLPGAVHLDASKRYYISVLPGDGVNPVIGGAGGPDANGKPFDIAAACGGLYQGPTGAWEPGGAAAMCGHAMGGAQISKAQVAGGAASTININLQETPLPTAKISVFVFEDDNPLNGENDAGGGVDVIAPNEPGLGGFEVKLFDQAGGLGDATGQITYDMFNMPVSNSLAGTIDPITGHDACPITTRTDINPISNEPYPTNLVGMIPTCPTYEAGVDSAGNKIPSPLAGQVVIDHLYPGLYEVVATPPADAIARGEEWLQTNTLDGGKPHEAFIKPNEPGYFQEFGPGGFHVVIGFARPDIINARRTTSTGTGICDPQRIVSGVNEGGGGFQCNAILNVQVTENHMSRTPDQRTYSTVTYDPYGFTQCYVAMGPPDGADFAFEKCDADGTAHFTNIPKGDWKITVFDQWNDLMLDGLVSPVHVDNDPTPKTFPVTQWRTNLTTQTYIDTNGDGIRQDGEPGLPLVATNIRYRDGSFGFFNNTDLQGGAGFNEVFPFMNWLVVESDTTRFKSTGTHVVYDAGGAVDGTTGGGSSAIADHVANTIEQVSLPGALRVPGAVYCAGADCAGAGETRLDHPYGGGADGSSGRIDPPWAVTEGWQGLLGQTSYIDFGRKPFAPGENGGIKGHVIYASTRPFDDPSLSLQLSWEPGVPRVTVNLYQEGKAADGTKTLKLVDTTTSSSWDDWAQGFHLGADGVTQIPNMNCPGQTNDSPFFATLQDSKQWLDATPKTPLPNHSQFKCYDGWSQLNQAQPAPYDGMYKFPSVTRRNPTTGRQTLADTNCSVCVAKPADPTLPAGKDYDQDSPMLPPGKYVVEVILPPGYELVKEEDKNILLGDVYVAPVTQQFVGLGNIYIMPDQAAVAEHYNGNSPGSLNLTNNLGASPRHEGDTGSVESFWPCVGTERTVPDLNSLYPGAGQAAPFAGATRRLCDRKEVILEDQAAVLAKFYIFSSTHIAGHFSGTMTNDFASEFDPFSPQFGEKFGPPNLPVGMRDFTGNEVGRVYSDQWGLYNGLYFSSYAVNPPNPTGYIPQMSIACMNDPGPIAKTNSSGQFLNAAGAVVASAELADRVTDPAYSPAYSNFCYETPFMPGFTAYMDTPVIPTMAFADGYNLPDSEYPAATPAISKVVSSSAPGPWVAGSGGVTSVTVSNRGSNYMAAPMVNFSPTGASAAAVMRIGSVTVTSANGSYRNVATPTVTIAAPPCTINGTTCVQAVGTATMSSAILTNANRKLTGVDFTGPGKTPGAGYTAPPTVTFSPSPTTGTLTPTVRLSVDSVVVSAGGTYTATPSVSFAATGGGSGASAAAVLGVAPLAGSTLTITALGNKEVQNPAFSGPNATQAPYNQKTVTRRFSFGGTQGTGSVTIGGVNAPVTSWSDTEIKVAVPNGIPSCAANGPLQKIGATTNTYAALCGELSITAGNGKQSIDTVTVTVGGKAPWIVSPSGVTPPTGGSPKDYSANFGRNFASPLQIAIDSADPGDLILVTPGTYRENLLMWKPVRLQGVGAASVTINADAHPAGKMDSWRRQVNCLFGLTLDGTPTLDGTGKAIAYDKTGTYSCPAAMYLRSDRIPFEGFVGWDASSNGNLAQVLQEPSLMGAYEGAGITVLGRGIRVPTNSTDLWGQVTGAGTFPDGSRYLSAGATDCVPSTAATAYDYGTANYFCNPSRIDGVSVINSSQGGGGIFMHGWNHNLEVGNTRIFGNHGTLAGGINLGNGETPPVFTNDGTICNAGLTPAPLCPPFGANTFAGAVATNAAIPTQLNIKVHVHHNSITDNASIGDALFSGTPAGAGGLTISAGSDGYVVDHNWISGNLSSSDGGGVQHAGLIFNGTIKNNWILFNQSVNPTLPTNGGGLSVVGANQDRTLPNGQECGTSSDVDCPPGIGDGTGMGLVIDSNLIMGNSAESGSGGGLRLQQLNGSEVGAFPLNPDRWYGATVTNNIIANNVAGWDGGGVSLQDALKVTFVNNTVVSNDTTASAGVLFKTLGAINSSAPPPGCTPNPDPNGTQNPNCLIADAPHIAQPAGLVTMENTPNLIEAMGAAVLCPPGFGYSGGLLGVNANCKKLSLPMLKNDLFWQNRAFHVDIVGAGTGLQSQQNLIALTPLLDQQFTGACADGASFWDVGVRNDTSPANHSGGATLSLSNSILTNTANYTGNGNVQPGASPLNAQYCNGARVPPENGGKGYNAPAGRSETTGLSPVFVFNGITPAATVDEGNNWINLTFGPLTLFSVEGQTMASSSEGPFRGAYSLPLGSPAVDAGAPRSSSGVPDHDYFGALRPATGVDIGAVELTAVGSASVRPSALSFGDVTLSMTSVAQTLTLTAGSTAMTGISAVVTAPFARSATAPGSCPAGGFNLAASTLAAPSACTINIVFIPGTAVGTASGTATITAGTGGPVVGSPVALAGTGVAVQIMVGPNLTFPTTLVGATSAVQLVTISNTSVPSVTVSGSFGISGAGFARSTAASGSCPANGTFTLAPSASCTIGVTFAPTATGTVTGTVTLTAAGFTVGGAPVLLTGTGTRPAVATATPNPLVVHTNTLGNTTGTGVVTMTNTAPAGSQSFTVSNVSISGSGFSINPVVLGGNTCTGATLAPAATCTVTVRYTRVTGTGTQTGTLTFTDTAPGGTHTVNLQGMRP